MQASRSKDKIIIGNNKNKLEDKDKDVETGDGVKGKDRDNIEYSSSCWGKFINMDDKDKFEDRTASIK